MLLIRCVIQGGDYTKIQDTAAWIASTNQSEHWRVIEVEQVVPVVDMLPDDIRSTVKMLMIPLLGQSVFSVLHSSTSLTHSGLVDG